MSGQNKIINWIDKYTQIKKQNCEEGCMQLNGKTIKIKDREKTHIFSCNSALATVCQNKWKYNNQGQ